MAQGQSRHPRTDRIMKNSLQFPHLLDCEILHDLADDQKSDFLNQCALQTYQTKSTILDQGQRSNGMFIVAHGSVEVSYISEEGFQTIIYHAGPCEANLGLLEALADRTCAATCAALPNTALLFCPTPLLYQLFQSPVMVRNLASLAMKSLERDNWGKSIDQHYTVEQRICTHLHQLSEQSAEIRQSQSYLASMVGCSRQTVNKELGVLREHEIIMLSKGKITVLSRDALFKRISQMNPEQS